MTPRHPLAVRLRPTALRIVPLLLPLAAECAPAANSPASTQQPSDVSSAPVEREPRERSGAGGICDSAHLDACGAQCEHGVARSCVTLASAHATGTGVPKSAEQATRLFQAGCDHGDAESCLYVVMQHIGVAAPQVGANLDWRSSLTSRAAALGCGVRPYRVLERVVELRHE